MKINCIHIRRYRAFDTQVDVPFHGLTVLTGPNNLGKSTVLSALDLFFSVFQPRTSLRLERGRTYDYESDYPKRYEGRAGRRWPTQIRAELHLEAADIDAITRDQPFQLPESIEVSIEFRYDERWGTFRPEAEVAGLNEENKRSLLIWLRNNVRYVYIPATRNVHDFRRSVFSELISGALHRVSRSRQRIQAIERFYRDILEEISLVQEELAGELRSYLPSIRDLRFIVDELNLEDLVSVRDVEIDDGARTPLHQKGDGFKSLFSISVLQYIARQRYGENLLFGIEEPEAHLHSSAIYEIKSTLRNLAESFQVIVTTHSPILIQRDNLQANIIVEHAGGTDFASMTRPARTLADIRRSLGIRPQENMTTAEVIIVVEGITEERIFPALLMRVQPNLEESIATGRIRVLSANTAANIHSVVRALARDAASCIVFVDADEEGLRAADRVRRSGLLKPTDVFQVPDRDGCRETEFEDLFEPTLYIGAVCAAAGLTVTVDEFNNFRRQSGNRQTRMSKWSNVMESVANSQGRIWRTVAEDAKVAFATEIANQADEIPVASLDWMRAIANQVQGYLREEQDVA